MTALLAQVNGGFEWSVGHIVIMIIVVCAIVGVLMIVLPKFGIVIPQWVWQILGICLLAFIAILAVRFLLSL